MQTTMDVCIVMVVEISKRLDYRPRFLGGGCAIKINQRMAAHLFAQNREIFAKGFPINNAGSNLVHSLICPAHRCAPLLFEEVNLTLLT